MAQPFSNKIVSLLEKKIFANVATIMPDGTPQVTPVWCSHDGQNVVFTTARGRQKDLNLNHDPRVSICLVDPENPYHYAEIRGHVVEMTELGADAHIDALAKKYLNVDAYPYRKPGEVRVIVKVAPDVVHVVG